MFSFKINKKSSSASNPVQKVSSNNVSKRAFNDDEEVEEEPDFIVSLEGNKIVPKKQGSNKPKKEKLVIPLITKNEWRIDKSVREEGDNDEPTRTKVKVEVPDSSVSAPEIFNTHQNGNDEDSLKQQAIKELMEGGPSDESEKNNKSRCIPILFENQVPKGYEEEDNMDVSLRPDQSTLDDYERIPIEEYGLAMLRGMGWKESEGIGLRNKKVVEMTEPKLRPKGMGLGAEAAHLSKDVAPKNTCKDDEGKEDLSFKIGGFVVITKGSKKGYYGQIESFDEDNNRVILKLAISGKMEAVSKFYVTVVSAKEYKKSSKVINSEKYEEYKTKQEERNNSHQDDDNRNSRHHHYNGSRRRSSRSSSRSSDEKESRARRDDREDTYYKDERKSSRHDRGDRSREDKDRSKHSSRKYDDKRYHESSSSRKDKDEYHKSSSRSDDRERRSDYRSKRDDDRSRDRRRDRY